MTTEKIIIITLLGIIVIAVAYALAKWLLANRTEAPTPVSPAASTDPVDPADPEPTPVVPASVMFCEADKTPISEQIVSETAEIHCGLVKGMKDGRNAAYHATKKTKLPSGREEVLEVAFSSSADREPESVLLAKASAGKTAPAAKPATPAKPAAKPATPAKPATNPAAPAAPAAAPTAPTAPTAPANP